MFWFKRNDTKEYIPVYDEVKDDIVNVPADEWIWIEGYKGTNRDMKCRGFQYEIGNQYDVVGDVKECENGFHLCKTLYDVFSWYELDKGNRFFKVKALVRKSDDINYGRRSDFSIGVDFYGERRKIVAKSIIFEEEITYSNGLKKYIDNSLKFIENEKEYESLKNIDYATFRKIKFIDTLKHIGYSEIFSNILYDMETPSQDEDKDLFDIIKKAKAFKEEGVSKDLSVYLLLK